jgi:DNA transposition AAA+ family ATPase
VILNVNERLQFQYLLPSQGNLKALELVDRITKKVFVSDLKEAEKEFLFESDEIQALKQFVKILDESNKLPFQALSVIRKIMEEKI